MFWTLLELCEPEKARSVYILEAKSCPSDKVAVKAKRSTVSLQVASKTLGIPTSKIYISETSTNTVPNASPTAASVSADINGMAVAVRNNSLTPHLPLPSNRL